jgi:hypothetical protein
VRRARLGGFLAAAALLGILLGPSRAGLLGTVAEALGGGEDASASASPAVSAGQIPAVSFEPALGMPATQVVVLGASPGQAREEAWAYGTVGDVPAIVNGRPFANQYVLLEHTGGSGWQVVPLPSGSNGESLAPNVPSNKFPRTLGALGGRTTAAGGVVLLTDGGIVTRDPGGQPQLVATPSTESKPRVAPEPEALLHEDESLPPTAPPSGAATPYAAIEDEGHTGILIAPYNDGAGGGKSTTSLGILHYDGVEWSREPIAMPGTQKPGLAPEAIACGGTSANTGSSSSANCWLLAAYETEASAGAPNRLALFKRVPAAKTAESPSGYIWEEESVLADPLALLGEPSPSGEPLSVTALGTGAQMLTVTSQGVWVDFQAKLGSGAATDVSKLVIPSSSTTANVAGTWCSEIGTVCPHSQAQPLGAPLPAQYQSFAWAGAGGVGGDFGSRILTGLPHGALLELTGGSFSHEIGAGGNVAGEGGAAFESSGQGWIGSGSLRAPDQQGQSQVIDVTSQPQGDRLQESPVPFRYPLLAVAQAPGSTPGDPGAQSVAVGLRGQIGHFIPGQGWRPESLYDSAGVAQTPTLRGVAWPQPGRAYAVGDNGAMWLWRADTGLWEPDPAKPLNFIGNLTAVAFSPTNPNLGYAVGKNGALLRFGKSWAQVSLPANLQQANFTSVAFAGGEALATYRTVVNGSVEAGGVAVEEDGSGLHWRVDPAASALLAQLPISADTVLSKVAGLPDGGAVAAGPGLVIERDSSVGPWRFSPQPLAEAQSVSALGAYREASGTMRAVVSIDLDPSLNPNISSLQTGGPWSGDLPPPSGPGQPPPFAPPDPLPNTGYLLKETAAGWEDMEHMALEASGSEDMPVRPDPVLALLVNPTGGSGLAVGGQTYDSSGSDNGSSFSGPEAPFETAAAMRFGVGATSVAADALTTIATSLGHATFAVGGEAACAAACADLAGESLGPDVSLSHALQSANQIVASSPGGLRGFLYTGGRLPAGVSSSLSSDELERELKRYESLLSGGGSLPVHAASSPGIGGAYYSFSSTGATGGAVTVIVLDYSTGALGAGQQEWLKGQLAAAKQQGVPAIVVGNASLGFTLPEGGQPVLQAQDGGAVSAILVQGGASAYLFDYPSANVQAQVGSGATHIPAFGTGTLGYTFPPGRFETDYLGSSGFLLVDIDTSARNPVTNIAPVSARIESNIGQLALNATDGVFLRRSQVALFEALARRPPQGMAINQNLQTGGVNLAGAEPYDAIPFNCLGANCADAVPTDYTFTSSNPDIGDFVAHDPTSANPRQVELGANRLPLHDPKSGLFCAFNSGTTIVSITTGGLTYAEPVTIQAGSVEYPCGTVPLKNPPLAEAPVQASFTAPELPPATSPPPVSPQIQAVLPPPPPSAPVHTKVHAKTPVATLLFVALVQPLVGARPAIVPPPAPPAARPIPPSGTSQVTVGAVEKEREEESATEIAASSKFAAYDVNQRGGPGPWILVLVLLAAGAGVGIGRGRRSSPRERPALALATSRRRGPWQ